MKEMKRVLALVLCLVMLVGILPVNAFAAPGDKKPGKETAGETVVETTEATEPEAPKGPAADKKDEEPKGPAADKKDEEPKGPAADKKPGKEETPAETEATVPVTEETVPETTEETVPETTEETVPGEAAATFGLMTLELEDEDYVDPGEYVAAALFFSDLHADTNDTKETITKSVMGSVATNTGLKFDTVTIVGDTFSSDDNKRVCDGDIDTIDANIRAGLNDANVPVLHSWSDHDRGSKIENKTGLLYGNANTDYYIYAISMSDMTSDTRYGVASTYNASKLTAFTETVESLDHSKPLFIATHVPLHDRRNDNQYADEWYGVISAAAEKMDVTVFWGHNHTSETGDDRTAYYIARGGAEKINVDGVGKVVPNFTYMNAGYMNNSKYNPNETCEHVVTAVKITEDSMFFTLIGESGVHSCNNHQNVEVPRLFKNAQPEVPDQTDPTTPSEPEGGEDEPETPSNPTTPTEPVTPPVTEDVPVPDSNNTGVTVTSPKVEKVKAEIVNDDPVVEAAVANLLTNYISYDITVEGDFAEGDTAVVAVPAPGLKNPAVFFVDTDGSTEPMKVLSYEDGVVTFETTHFSNYTVGDSTEIDVPEPSAPSDSTETTEEKNVYVLVEKIDGAGSYLISNANTATTDAHLLTRNKKTVKDTSGVTVSSGKNKSGDTVVYIENPKSDDAVWIAEAVNGTTNGYTLKSKSDNNRYLQPKNNGLAADAKTTLYSTKNSVYATFTDRFGTTNYYVRYNSGWGTSSNSGTVYIYKQQDVEFVTTVSNKYSIAGKPAKLNVAVEKDDTAVLNSVLTITPSTGSATTTNNPTGVTYAVYKEGNVDGDPNNVIESIDGNIVTFTGKTGTALVQISYKKDFGTVTNYIEVVAVAPVYSMTIQQPASTVVKTDATLDLNATIKKDGQTVERDVTWSIPADQQGIATVDASTGMVTPVSAGKVTVMATYTDPRGNTITKSIELTIEEPVYTLSITAPESTVKIGNTLDLTAEPLKDGAAVENADITWSLDPVYEKVTGTPVDGTTYYTYDEETKEYTEATGLTTFEEGVEYYTLKTVATISEDGVLTGVAEGFVTVNATWTVGGKVITDSVNINVVGNVWTLELCQPTWTEAKSFESGVTYYVRNAETLEYVEAGNLTGFQTGVTYYTLTTTPIEETIVLKNVKPNQTFVNLWAVIYCDGEDIGKLDAEDILKLNYTSSDESLAVVEDPKISTLTFKGETGVVNITASYEYAEGKFVTDTVVFSLSKDSAYLPNDGTPDFPEYPNEGAIRFDKTATAVGNFSQTGIAQMELSMTGVPYSKGVDIIVMLDMSSSMTRCIDHDTKNHAGCTLRIDDLVSALEELETQLKGSDNAENIRIAMADFNGFFGSDVDEKINGVAVSGSTPYDRERADYLDAQFANGVADANVSIYTGSALNASAFIPVTSLNIASLENKLRAAPSSGTNYDYAFDAIYQLGHSIKEANGEDERDLYVIFMSDGAPNQYNYFNAIGGDKTTDGSKNWDYWLTGTADKYNGGLAALTSSNNHDYYYDEETGNQHRMANAIRGNPGTRYEVIRKSTDGMAGKTLDGKENLLISTGETNMYTLPGLGAKMYSVAFDISNDGAIDKTSVEHVLKNIPTGGPDSLDYYLEADKPGALVAAFGKIAGEIVEAAKDVRVTDKMDSHFTMVFDAPNTTVDGHVPEGQEFYIEFKEYPLKAVTQNGVVTDYLRDTDNATSKIKVYLGINDGKTYYAATAANSKANANKFATPVFNTNPVGTRRYWTADAAQGDSGVSVKGADGNTYYFISTGKGSHNMVSGAYAFGNITTTDITDSDGQNKTITNSTSTDLIIATPYFVYNADTKLLVWTAEKLTTTELVMTYFLYLDKSGGYSGMDGETLSGAYNTNEFAVMNYTNFKEHECEVEFPKPQITWNGAQVTYVFYLVNENGQPVNRAGTVVPFSEAVYVTDPATYTVVWNELEQVSSLEAKYLATGHVPSVFQLFDEGATYDIHVFEDEDAQNLNNHFVISSGSTVNPNTTYVFNAKADANKYREPGTYSAGENYLCKDYDGVSGVTRIEHWDEFGNVYYTYTGGQYNGSGEQYKEDGNAFYGMDEKGMYTVIKKTGATPVHAGFDFHTTTVAFAVVWTPRLNPDTVVIDYGLDVMIDVTSNDGVTSELKGIRTTKPAATINTGFYSGSNFNSQIDVKDENIKVATASVEGQKVRFTLDKQNGMEFKKPALFYYESQVAYTTNTEDETTEGSNTVERTMYSSVTVIPATTVYYEDEYVTLTTRMRNYDPVTDGQTFDRSTTYYTRNSETNAYEKVTIEAFESGVTYYTSSIVNLDGWPNNSVKADALQATDRPGLDKMNISGYDADNVYGYDSAYDNCSTYSLGNAASVTVNKDTSAYAEFEFYGTGFDVISMTSNDTGTITVLVKDSTGAKVKNTIVDTYYGVDEKGVYVQDGAALYQVPVMKIMDLPYGKYSVKITASYNSLFEHVEGSDSYDFYLDAIRIYDPTGNKNSTANNAYVQDGEGWPVYQELRNNVIAAADYHATNTASGGAINGIAFIDNANKTMDVADYISYGPNNELYLAKDQGIVFGLDLHNYADKVASIHMGAKSADSKALEYAVVDAEVIMAKASAVTKQEIQSIMDAAVQAYVTANPNATDANKRATAMAALEKMLKDDYSKTDAEITEAKTDAVYALLAEKADATEEDEEVAKFAAIQDMAAEAIYPEKFNNVFDAQPTKKLATSTDMYYDITDLFFETDAEGERIFKDPVIIIRNAKNSQGILSLTNIKVTFNDDPGEVKNIYYVDYETITKVLESGDIDLSAEESFDYIIGSEEQDGIKMDVQVPEYVIDGKPFEVTVTTTEAVDRVTINNDNAVTGDGTYWTIYWTENGVPENNGYLELEVTAYYGDDKSMTTTVATTVAPKLEVKLPEVVISGDSYAVTITSSAGAAITVTQDETDVSDKLSDADLKTKTCTVTAGTGDEEIIMVTATVNGSTTTLEVPVNICHATIAISPSNGVDENGDPIVPTMKTGEVVTFTITTDEEIELVTVYDEPVTTYRTVDGSRIWTAKYSWDEAGKYEVGVTLSHVDGYELELVTRVIEVEPVQQTNPVVENIQAVISWIATTIRGWFGW